MEQQELQRYDDSTRMNHWGIALMFFLAALSGLAFFHPSLFFLSNLFGGGPWTRILHPYLGLVMVLLFLVMFFRLWRENVINDSDKAWMAKAGEMLQGNKENMPPVGKYNAGQKINQPPLISVQFNSLIDRRLIKEPARLFAPDCRQRIILTRFDEMISG